MSSRPRIAIASMSLSLAMLFGAGLAAHADALPTVKRTGETATVKRTGETATVKRTGETATVKRTGDTATVKRTGVISADAALPLDVEALVALGLFG